MHPEQPVAAFKRYECWFRTAPGDIESKMPLVKSKVGDATVDTLEIKDAVEWWFVKSL